MSRQPIDFSEFEVFVPPHGYKQPAVTLSQNRIVLNRAAHTALGQPEQVEILVSKDKRQVALRPVTAGGIKLSINGASKQATLHHKKLFTVFNLQPGPRSHFISEGVLVFEMDGES